MISSSKLNVSKGHAKVGLLTITAIASLCAPLANAAPIYKVVDEQTGQVTFTDRPQSYEQQVGKQVSQTTVTTGNETSGSNNSTRDNQTATNATQTASIPATNDATVKDRKSVV